MRIGLKIVLDLVTVLYTFHKKIQINILQRPITHYAFFEWVLGISGFEVTFHSLTLVVENYPNTHSKKHVLQ